MPQPFDQFILVKVIGEDADTAPEASMFVSLPAILRWGDTLVLEEKV